MDNHRFRRVIEPWVPVEDELRAFIEGESAEEIVRQVSDAFADELAQIMRKARDQKVSSRRS